MVDLLLEGGSPKIVDIIIAKGRELSPNPILSRNPRALSSTPQREPLESYRHSKFWATQRHAARRSAHARARARRGADRGPRGVGESHPRPGGPLRPIRALDRFSAC